MGPVALVIGACAVAVSEMSGAPHWVTMISAIVLFSVTILVEPMLAQGERNTSNAISLRRAAPETVGGKLPKIRDVDLKRFKVRNSIHDFPYVARPIDGVLAESLKRERRAIVVGRSMSGRSRLVAEAAKQLFPKHRLWTPTGPSAVLEFTAQGHGLSKTVVFLDDLDRFTVGDGITSAHLQRLLGRDNIVVATLRSSALSSNALHDTDMANLQADCVDWFSEPVWVPLWTEEEVRQALTQNSSSLPVEAVVAHGLSGYLAGSQLLLQRFEVARTEGMLTIRLLKLLIEMSRCGLTEGLLRSSIHTLLRDRDPEIPTSEQATEQALAWCMQDVAPGLAMVYLPGRDGERLKVMDLLVERTVRDEATDISRDTWNTAMSQAQPADLVEIGERAYFGHGIMDIGLEAWESSDSPVALFYRAQHLVNCDDEVGWGRAETMLRTALAELDSPEVKTVLAIVLEKLAGGEYADVEESRTLYKEAADAGETTAAFNAGVSALRAKTPGWEADAEKYLRQAWEAGHTRAPGVLSGLFDDLGRADEARDLLEVAANTPGGDPDDAAAFGQLLIEQGDTVRGQVWLERAVSRGSDEGAVRLSQYFLRSENPRDLARGSRLLDGVDDSRFSGVLALRGLLAIGRGLLAEGEQMLREGHGEGDLHCKLELATYILEREARRHFADGRLLTSEDVPDEVFELLDEVGKAGVAEGYARASAFYYSLEMHDDAVSKARAAVDCADAYDEVRAQLATALLRRGKPSDFLECVEILSRILENLHDPTSDLAARSQNNLGMAYSNLGRTADADRAFAAAAKAGSVNGMGHYSSALVSRGGVVNTLRARAWQRKQARIGLAVARQSWREGTPDQISSSPVVPNLKADRSFDLRRLLRREYIQILGARFYPEPGPRSIWSICYKCGVPFGLASGAYIMVPTTAIEDMIGNFAVSSSSCPRCRSLWRRASLGLPLLSCEARDDWMMISGNYDDSIQGPLTVGVLLAQGSLDVSEGLDWLRRSTGPLGTLPDVLEARQATPTVAAALVAACVAVLSHLPGEPSLAELADGAEAVRAMLEAYESDGLVPKVAPAYRDGEIRYFGLTAL